MVRTHSKRRTEAVVARADPLVAAGPRAAASAPQPRGLAWEHESTATAPTVATSGRARATS